MRGYQNGRFYINDSIQERGLKNGKIIMEEQILGTAMNTYSRFKWPSALILVGLTVNKGKTLKKGNEKNIGQ